MSNSTLEHALITLTLADRRLKEVAIACATLLVYDHATSLDEEVDHFWKGRWTLSSVLYFCIRYLSLTWALLQLFGFVIFTMVSVCGLFQARKMAVRVQDTVLYEWISLLLIAPTITLCQATITLRVWYLFYKTPAIKTFALTMFVLCISATYISAGLLWDKMRVQSQALTSSPMTSYLSSAFVWLFVPSLVIHTILFALKVYRFMTSPTYMQTDTLLWRFMKEGMFMYIFALGSLLYTIIGITLTSLDDLPIYFAALNGCTVITTVVIAVCRAMLSIRSLAATGHVSPSWLLNHAEMSRVQWRHGTIEGEIVVEMNAV